MFEDNAVADVGGLRVSWSVDQAKVLADVCDDMKAGAARTWEDAGVEQPVGALTDVEARALADYQAAVEHRSAAVRMPTKDGLADVPAADCDIDLDSRAPRMAAGVAVPLRYLHDPTKQIGHLLSLEESDARARFEAVLAHSSLGQDVAALIDSGSLRMVSIGFVPLATDERYVPGLGKILRRTSAELIESSLVPVGAYAPHARPERLYSADPDRVRKSGARRRNAARMAAIGVDLDQTLADAALERHGVEQLRRRWAEATPEQRKFLRRVMPARVITD